MNYTENAIIRIKDILDLIEFLPKMYKTSVSISQNVFVQTHTPRTRHFYYSSLRNIELFLFLRQGIFLYP